MNFFKRLFIGIILFTSMIILSLLGVAFLTKYWIVATATKNLLLLTTTSTVLPSFEVEAESLAQNTGKINFGLFEGYKELNHGLGVRTYNISIICSAPEGVCMWADDKQLSNSERQNQIRNELFKIKNSLNITENVNLSKEGFFNFYLWVSVVVLLSLAVLHDLIAVGFTILNFVTVPVNTLTGIVGLYVWNGLSAIFSFSCVIVWAILFHLEFRNNVMNQMDVRADWTSKDSATFGYSLWMVVGAGIMSVANLILIFGSTLESWTIRRTNMVINEKPPDGIIMLY